MKNSAYIKSINISPKKLRFLLLSVKKQSPAKAVELLFYMREKSAHLLRKAIMSAISNATSTLKTSPDLLQFNLLTVEQGKKLKRFNPGGRGTAKPYVKRLAHIKISLGVRKIETKNAITQEVKQLPKTKKEVHGEPKKITSKSPVKKKALPVVKSKRKNNGTKS